MRKTTKFEIIFGIFALALIYVVINNNASITGFVISPAATITLVAPADNTQTKESSIYFQFQYPPELEAQQCVLLLNGQVAKTATGLLEPYNTKIRMDLVPGTYDWKIECADSSGLKIESVSRRLIIGSASDSELKITKFPNRAGYAYEFEIKDDMELKISNVVPNDALQAKKGENTYELEVLRVYQDYSTGTEFVELITSPGDKRITLSLGESASIDFNNDGINEMRLILEEVSYGKANFIVTTKPENAPEEDNTPAIEEPTIIIKPADDQKPASEQKPAQITTAATTQPKQQLGFIELFLLGMAVVLIVAIISALRTRPEKEKKYVSELKKKAETTAVKRSIPARKAPVKKKAKKKKKK